METVSTGKRNKWIFDQASIVYSFEYLYKCGQDAAHTRSWAEKSQHGEV